MLLFKYLHIFYNLYNSIRSLCQNKF